MGCSTSRPELNSEEQLLTAHEAYMDYAQNHIVYADMVIRKNSPHLQLNQSQLIAVATQLRLKLDNIGPSDIAAFYLKLKSSVGYYPLNSLVLTAFLLCYGSEDEKAKVLFELYDDRNSEVIDALKIGSMANDIFEIACVHLPIIANGPQTSAADRMALKIYIAKIKYVKDQFVQRFASAFLKAGSRVNKKDFVSVYVNEWPSKTVTSHGFRSAVFNDFATSSEAIKMEFDRSFKLDNRLSSYVARAD